MWLFLLQGAMLPVVCHAMESDRRRYWRSIRRYRVVGILGGLVSMAAYAIVIWAQSLAPLALVSALRETSVLLAGIIGFLVFKERFSPLRLLITGAAAAEIVIIQLS